MSPMSQAPQNDIALSIVVPAYNEADRILPTLARLIEWLDEDGRSAEILVVDDGSSDDTCGVVRSKAASDSRLRLLENGVNRGKGYSVAHGVRESQGAWVLFSDADLSTPVEELLKLEAGRGDAPISIGSRALPDSDLKKRQPFYREMMGRSFNLLVQTLVFPGIQDTQCGFKLFRADVARDLFERRTIDGFAFDVEVLFLARKHGHTVIEIPVVWINDEASRVDPIRHSLRMFADIMKIRGRHRG
jgi:dolichyl-phosphate beta-glucosyltransferase